MNPFAFRARASKVAALLAAVPVGRDATETQIIADWLAAMSVAEREAFAKHAGQRAPSDITWRLVIEAARARVGIDEVAS